MAFDQTKLTGKQRTFGEEYVLDLNARQAAKRAGYAHPDSDGSIVLALPHVRAYIDELLEQRAQRNAALQDRVLKQLEEIVFGDVNEVVQYRRTACRYCHGINNRYQWTAVEFERAQEAAEHANAKMPFNPGGYGYDRKAEANPDCPECSGEGRGDVFAMDSRKLSPTGKLLYAGAKSGRDGLEVKVIDVPKHREMLMRHLGMFKDKVEHSGAIESTGPVLNLTLTTPDAEKAKKVAAEKDAEA